MEIVALFILFAGVLYVIVPGNPSVIPTKAEQVNLLTNVEEVFKQLKILMYEEGNSTDESVVVDVTQIVKRAQEKLALISKLSLVQLSCTSNSVCMLETKPIIQAFIDEGVKALNSCIQISHSNITVNSLLTTNSTESALNKGQELLDALYKCSTKSGLLVISCYKAIIDSDVVPTKDKLLAAINAHKEGHENAIRIRNQANECVDTILETYQNKVQKLLEEGLSCK